MSIVLLSLFVTVLFIAVCIYLFRSDKERKDKDQNGGRDIFDKLSW